MKIMFQIIAAHICYLVAEATFEPYSDSARLCLIGADHLKFPRTFASPDAIQVLFNCHCPLRCSIFPGKVEKCR